MGRQAAGFEPHDVGDIDAGERLAAAGEVAGAEDLEVVGRGVAAEAEVLAALAEDLVADGIGDAAGAEAAGGEVVAVVHEALHRLGDGHDLVDEPARFFREGGAGGVGTGIGEEGHAIDDCRFVISD